MKGNVFDSYMAVSEEKAVNKVWHSPDEKPMCLEGFYWRKQNGAFRRLPEKSESCPLPPGVDHFADHSSGGILRLKTDSDEIFLKASLKTTDNAADIMTLGRVGFDCYEKPAPFSHYIGSTRMNFDKIQGDRLSYCVRVFQNPGKSKSLREFTIYFPLYAEVKSLEIGLDADARMEAPSPRINDRPIVIYGTSIQQGCCASRPALSGTNRIARMLNRPILNFGFSGSGRGEPEVARVLAEIQNPAMFILDYDSNSTLESLEQTLPVFTDILREKHPEVPIMTVSKMDYPADYPLNPNSPHYSPDRIIRTSIHMENLTRRLKLGDRNIHFLDGILLYGADYADCSVDNCHPNDIGFERIANVMSLEIQRILSV